MLGLLLCSSTQVFADSARDRCAVKDCTCRVIPGPKPGEKITTQNINRRHGVYFQEDSSEIVGGEMNRLKYFVNSREGKSQITLLAYTDGCGSRDHNLSLAESRARSVRSIIRNIIPSAKIDVKIIGEKSQGHLPEARRVDVIVHTSRRLTTEIEKIPADFYLIDASGSMWDGWASWKDVVGASIKPGGKVYLSIMKGCRNGQSMSSISPQGGTEIWYSYWRVLDFMKSGQTLLIVSDFDSNFRLTWEESQAIERKVREKGVRVYTVQ